jgi:cytidylate kinase
VKRIVVAIDGPAGAGKSTVTRRVAQKLGYELLDTGALYRLVALVARRRQIPWNDEARLAEIARELSAEVRFEWKGDENRVWLGDDNVSEAIRTREMSGGASEVSALPGVRRELLNLQRSLGQRGGVVCEGRDIGTVVFPNAEVKFFLTASPEVRAQRRTKELEAAGQTPQYEQILAEVVARDERDSSRATAPLTQAPDAILIDSSTLSIDEVVDQMVATVGDRTR